MPRIILLTAGYGEGHNAAARGLQAAFIKEGAEVETVDLFELTSGAFYKHSRRGYIELINRAPKIWAAVYRLFDRLPLVSLTSPLLGRMRRTLHDLLKQKRPDAVVSVYPIYGYLIERLYPSDRPFAFHTVVTDSITINSVWHRCASDTFLVANEDTARVMAGAGVPRRKLHTLGFPVQPRFSEARPVRSSPPPARVLYMINAGRDQAVGIVRRLLGLKDLHLTVTVGRDAALGETLRSLATDLGRPLEVHGWTLAMPELLMSHHLLIGKAGGATVQETIAAGTPMLLTQIIPGQEEGNAQLLIENECGAFCPTIDLLADTVARGFQNEAAVWRQWESNIRRLSRPGAAGEIARFVLAYAANEVPATPQSP